MAKIKYWNGTTWETLDAKDADTLDGKHAETALTTTEKNDLAGAINEVKSLVDSHKAEIASTTTRGHVQLSSAVNSTREDLAATPKAVKMAYDKASEKPFVVGTYTGNGSSSRTISLGFRPSAVIVFTSGGATQSSTGDDLGGLALDGYPVIGGYNGIWDVVTITSNGFTVYYDTDHRVYSNTNKSSYYYIAFK